MDMYSMFSFDQEEIAERLIKYPIFNKFSPHLLRELMSNSEIIEYPAGTILFNVHDPSDCVYYVIDGYVELFSSSNFEKKIVSVRSGGMLGETSVISGESHGFSAKTIKLSQLIKIHKDVFLKFFQKDPDILMQLTQNVARRLRRMVMGLTTERYPYKNIVLYNTCPMFQFEKVKSYFHTCALEEKTHIYDRKTFEATQLDIVPFLFQCESKPGVNIFLAEPGENIWDKTVLLHAEYIYLVMTEGAWDSVPMNIIDGESSRPCDIVIWHEKPEPYTNTDLFYTKHAFKRHHHFRDEQKFYERLYRYMTGQAIGLVISAGGFRGYAHYGLIKAILESGIPIDCIGGCSFGAAIGAGLAENFDWEYFKAIYEKSIVKFKNKKSLDFTLPITSILSGKFPTNLLQEVYQERRIENLPINFFCITGNLSTRQKEIKYSGKIWEWLRASIAVPGVFPPFEKDGNIYVDGAVCTSLPVQDMRKYLDGGGKIISLDVRLLLLLKDKHKYAFPPILSFKDVLSYKFGFSKKNYVLPSILDILLESSSIESHMSDKEGAKKADILIAPDTSSLSFSNPSIGDPQSLIAYTFAKEKLKEHKEIFERWL
jgi:NTE family protein